MEHSSLYLDWYIHVPKVEYDFRASGITHLKHDLILRDADLSITHAHGNPETSELLARRYHVQPENVFISSDGTSGQNARFIRYLAEKNKRKNEAVVEYPTYEPLLRQVQEHFTRVKRVERKEEEAYRLDANALRKIVSEKTSLLALTNPHAPSGAISDKSELKDIMTVAGENGFYVLCDEIYAEFDRNALPNVFSLDEDLGIVTTSFTKAYGLGGLKLGIALANKGLVDELYTDVLNTVGNYPSIIQLVAVELLTKDYEILENHKQKWTNFKKTTEEWLSERNFEYFPNEIGITYWVELSIKDTYKWVNEHAIPRHRLAVVPGAFFLFNSGRKIVKSNKIRLGLGNVNPDKPNLAKAFEVLEEALTTYQTHSRNSGKY